MNTLSNALPLMVSSYSKLFGITVRMQGTNAYTNGKTITIPRLDMTNPVKARLAYGYLAHEASHVRFTDFELLNDEKLSKDVLLKSLLNILEDCRIEKLIAREFIGVYENLVLLNDYYEADWRKFLKNIKYADTITLILCFIQTYAQSKVQKFKSSRDKAALIYKTLKERIEKPSLKKLVAIIKKSFTANSTKEIFDICKEIYAHVVSFYFQLKDYQLPKEQPKRIIDLSTYRRAVDQMIKSKMAKRNKKLVDECTKFLQSCLYDYTRATPNQGAAFAVEMNGAGTSASSREDYGLFTAQECREGDPDFIKNTDDSYGLRMALRNKVQGYVQSYANHTYTSNRIDPKKAQKVCVGESMIFKDKLLEKDFATSVHVLVDVSSSMLTTDGEANTRAFEACKTALMIALALESIDGIKSMVAFFPGFSNEYEIALRETEKASKVAARFDQKPRGSTPLAQAFWYALGKIIKLECQRNIVIVITDGMPDSINNTKQCFEYAKKHNVEVYGISVRSELISKLFENSIILDKASMLEEKSFSLLSKLFDVSNKSMLKPLTCE